MTTLQITGMDPTKNIEAGYSNYELLTIKAEHSINEFNVNGGTNASNIWSRLSRVIYSIFDWSSNYKQYDTYPNDNNV